MPAQIVSIRGSDGFIPVKNPDQETIELLETLLAEAKAGEIVGIIGASYLYDKSSGSFRTGWSGPSQLGSLHIIAHKLASEFS